MASLSAAEGEYDSVVTLDLLRKPFLTACCGNHLSQEEVTRLQGQPCPVCKKANLHAVPEKVLQHKFNELKVCCPNKSLGCEWVGGLGSLDRHLSQNSVEGECQFVTVACPHSCGDSFQRCQLEGHKANDCLRRPFTCQHCDHKAPYIAITDEHLPICKQYPLQCPNKCGEKAIERQHLPKHLEETCPLQVIKCEFSYAGCEVECQRQHMHTHLEENVKVHLNKVSHTQQSINEQLQKQIATLMSALTRVALDAQKPLAPPPDMVMTVMTDFEKHKNEGDRWFSPPFYSHTGGYKMCLCVYANGLGDGEYTHVSVFVHLMRGEYDDQLKWPFRGDITIQLLNQSRDEERWEKTVVVDDRASDKYAGRVVRKERAPGLGYHQFIPYTELNTENKEYLKSNCLMLRISQVVVKSL